MKLLRRVLVATAALILCQLILLAAYDIRADKAELASAIDRVVPGGGAVWTIAVENVIPSDGVIYARRIISPTFNSPLALKFNQRLIVAAGHIACTAGERFEIEVTLTQPSTGALAMGRTEDFCTGERQEWDAIAAARGPVPFAVGPAQACGTLRTRFRGAITDSFQWCKDVLLVQTE